MKKRRKRQFLGTMFKDHPFMLSKDEKSHLKAYLKGKVLYKNPRIVFKKVEINGIIQEVPEYIGTRVLQTFI